MSSEDIKSWKGRLAIESGKKKKRLVLIYLHLEMQEVELDKLNLLDLWK